MVSYYTGTPGSGKSYHLARDIYKWLSEGKNVISNFPVNFNMVKPLKGKNIGQFIFVSNTDWQVNPYYFKSDNGDGSFSRSLYDPQNKRFKTQPSVYGYIQGLIGFALNFHTFELVKDPSGFTSKQFNEHQTLLVFDECHVLWNSRNWKRSDRLTWIDFFKEHRKFGYDVIFTSQDDKATDKQLKAIFENEVLHRKFFNFVKPVFLGRFLRFLFKRECFVCVVKKYGIRGKEAVLRSFYIWGNQFYYDFYNTSAIFSFSLDPEFKGCISLPEEPAAPDPWLDVLIEMGVVEAIPPLPDGDASTIPRG